MCFMYSNMKRFKKYNQCVSTLFCNQGGHDTVSQSGIKCVVSRLAAQICHFLAHSAESLFFCDKKCRILAFRDKTVLNSVNAC